MLVRSQDCAAVECLRATGCSRPYPCVAHAISDLFRTKRFTDVRFRVGIGPHREVFVAHRAVLAARSEVFAVMLFGAMRESQRDSEIEINDVPADAFRNVLAWIYQDACDINTETVLSTLYTAKKYLVGGLSMACVQFLDQALCADNACELLEQALLFDEMALAYKCRHTIETHAVEVVPTEAFANLSEPAMRLLLQGLCLRVPPLLLAEAMTRWLRVHSSRAGAQSAAAVLSLLDPAVRHALPRCGPPVPSAACVPSLVGPAARAAPERVLGRKRAARSSAGDWDAGPSPPPARSPSPGPPAVVAPDADDSDGLAHVVRRLNRYAIADGLDGTRRSRLSWSGPATDARPAAGDGAAAAAVRRRRVSLPSDDRSI